MSNHLTIVTTQGDLRSISGLANGDAKAPSVLMTVPATGSAGQLCGQHSLKKMQKLRSVLLNMINQTSPVIRIESKVCLKGGALVADGDGTLLATQSSILNENRNPEMSRSENEEELNSLLGTEKITWFPGRKGLDVTDVHADAEVTFIRPGVVVLSRPHPSALKTRMDIYEEIRDILQDTLDAKGRTFEVHVVDEPDPGVLGNLAYDEPATTYLNCYFVNGGLILSQFGDAQRVQEALALFRALCPNRVVQPVHVTGLPLAVGIDALAYRHTGGSIDPMNFVILD